MRKSRKVTTRILTRREALHWLAMTGASMGLAACGGKTAATSLPVREPVQEQPTHSQSEPSQPTLKSPVVEQPAKQPEIGRTEPVQNTSVQAAGQAYLAAARGEDPAAITEAALKALGGIERFVKQGYDVIIKPNMCTDYYTYEYAATTNPVVVATLVRLALGAGAKRVRVMDFPFGGTAESAYAKSGIADAVNDAGGEMEVMNRNKFRNTPVPEGQAMQEWLIYQEVLTCDLLIDVPIVKHHSLARMTAGMKNLMGVIQSRNNIHAQMSQRLPDLYTIIRPDLIVVDAVRTLMANGPTGGNLDDVKLTNTVIASQDIVASDAYAATLLKLSAKDIPYIQNAAQRGLGTMDLSSVKVEEISL